VIGGLELASNLPEMDNREESLHARVGLSIETKALARRAEHILPHSRRNAEKLQVLPSEENLDTQ